jgi:hypothetical protein
VYWAKRTACCAAGFAANGVVQGDDPDYVLSIADRGADTLAADGRIGRELADALKAEARRRVAARSFFRARRVCESDRFQAGIAHARVTNRGPAGQLGTAPREGARSPGGLTHARDDRAARRCRGAR